MVIGKYTFHPDIILTIIMFVLLALFIRLGVWQLSRAEEKETLKETMDYRDSLPPLLVDKQLKADAGLRFRKIVVRGSFLVERQFFLEGRKHRGRAGYHVVSPLRIEGTDIQVLVNRGWVETGNDWNVLPTVSTPEGPVQVTGMIDIPSKPPFISAPAADSGEDWGKRWPFIDLDYYVRQTGGAIQPFVMLQSPLDAHGFVREWPVFNPKKGMHIGYAIQWFAFAVITLVIYLVLSLTRREKQTEAET